MFVDCGFCLLPEHYKITTMLIKLILLLFVFSSYIFGTRSSNGGFYKSIYVYSTKPTATSNTWYCVMIDIDDFYFA